MGDTLTYTITATNTGTSTLTDVVVTDPKLTRTAGTAPCEFVTRGSICTLIGTYVVTAADITAGSIANTATADSDQTPSVNDSVTVPVQGTPGLRVDKPVPVNADEDRNGAVSIGDTLTYTITATNTGDVPLTEVVVTDALVVRTGGTSPCPLVAPGGTCTLIGTYIVTSLDVTARQFRNVAIAESEQTDPVDDEVIVTVRPAPAPIPPSSPPTFSFDPVPAPTPTPVAPTVPAPTNPLALTGAEAVGYATLAAALLAFGSMAVVTKRRREGEIERRGQ